MQALCLSNLAVRSLWCDRAGKDFIYLKMYIYSFIIDCYCWKARSLSLLGYWFYWVWTDVWFFVCRQLIQLWEILLCRIESGQIWPVTHPKCIARHMHHLMLWQLVFLMLFLENRRKRWRLWMTLLCIRVECLSLAPQIQLERICLPLFSVSEFVLMLLLFMNFVITAFRGIIGHLAYDATQIVYESNYIQTTYLLLCWLWESPTLAIKLGWIDYSCKDLSASLRSRK